MSEQEKKPWVHPWEEAKLGKAPFRLTGYSQEIYQAHRDAPIQPGTTCDFCGQGIMNVFHIESADHRRFKVGEDCAKRTGDTELIVEMRREKRMYRTPEQIAHAKAYIEAEAARKAQEQQERMVVFAQRYEQVIRDATAALGADHVPEELRADAEKVLQGLVTELPAASPLLAQRATRAEQVGVRPVPTDSGCSASESPAERLRP